MGIYSGSIGSGMINIQEAEGYDEGIYSAQLAMIESAQNNLAMIEGVIKCDITEAYMRANNNDEDEILLFSENVLTSMLGKIKEFLKKVWAKIKAIFKGFMARIDSVMMKSNKEFVNKYKDTVLKKDLTDFEVKWRKPKGGKLDPEDFKDTNAENRLDTHNAEWVDLPKAKAYLEKWDEDKNLESILVLTLKNQNTCDVSEYEKDFLDSVFEDEDNDDKINIYDIMSELIAFKETKKAIDKNSKSLNKAMDNMVKIISKDEDALVKDLPLDKDGHFQGENRVHKTYSFKNGSDWEAGSRNTQNSGSDISALTKGTSDKDAVETFQKQIAIVHKWAVLYQTAATKYTAAVMKAYKMYNSGLRKVWAKAVAYNRKKDESVMMEAMADLAEWEEDVDYLEESGKSKKKKSKKKSIKGLDEDDDSSDTSADECGSSCGSKNEAADIFGGIVLK